MRQKRPLRSSQRPQPPSLSSARCAGGAFPFSFSFPFPLASPAGASLGRLALGASLAAALIAAAVLWAAGGASGPPSEGLSEADVRAYLSAAASRDAAAVAAAAAAARSAHGAAYARALCAAVDGRSRTGAASTAMHSTFARVLHEVGGLARNHTALMQAVVTCGGTDDSGSAVVGAAAGCPLYDAVHLRDTVALRAMLPRAAGRDVLACLAEVDAQGERALHNAARGKASGLARFFRAARNTALGRDTALYLDLDADKVAHAVRGIRGERGRGAAAAATTGAGKLYMADMEAAAGDAALRLVVRSLQQHAALLRDALGTSVAPVDLPTETGDTALGLAAQSGRPPATLQWLVEQGGADVNARNALGRTPLHLAATGNMLPQAQALLALGADASAKDADGRTAGDVARLLGHAPLAALLGAGGTQGGGQDPPHGACGIAVLNADEAANMTAAHFYRHYVSLLRPVLLRGLTPAAPGSGRRLTWAELDRSFGSVGIAAAAVPYADLYGAGETVQRMSLGDFLRRHLGLQADGSLANDGANDGAEAAPYIFDAQLLQRVPALRRAIPPPTHLLGSRLILEQFMAGSVNSGAAPHFHGHALNLLAQGEKQWQLLPPSSAYYRFVTAAAHFRDAPDGGALQCRQAAGDALYVPAGWSHAVLNTQPSLAVAYEFSPTFAVSA